MGYSPGEFVTRAGSMLHFELKDNGRILLWNEDESVSILEVDREQGARAAGQLLHLAEMASK